MWLLMVSMPQGELHVGFPPCCFQEGISKCIVITAALCSTPPHHLLSYRKHQGLPLASQPLMALI